MNSSAPCLPWEEGAMAVGVPSLLRTLRGHKGAVNAASFHPDLQQIASASNDGMVMLWSLNCASAAATCTLPVRSIRLLGHQGAVRDVVFNGYGSLLASSGDDGTVRLWEPKPQGDAGMIRGHTGAVRCVRFSSDSNSLITASDDKSVKIWDSMTQKFITSFQGHKNWVRACAISPDLQLCASGGDDRVVHVWSPTTHPRKQPVCSFFSIRESVTSLAFHPDGNVVAAGSADRTINLWDLRSPQRLLQHYNGHNDVVSSIDFDPTGAWLISSGIDGELRLWDLCSGYLHCIVKSHEGAVISSRFSPCGSRLVSTGVDRLVLMYNTSCLGTCVSPPQELALPLTAQEGGGVVESVDDINGISHEEDSQQSNAALSRGGNAAFVEQNSTNNNNNNNHSTNILPESILPQQHTFETINKSGEASGTNNFLQDLSSGAPKGQTQIHHIPVSTPVTESNTLRSMGLGLQTVDGGWRGALQELSLQREYHIPLPDLQSTIAEQHQLIGSVLQQQQQLMALLEAERVTMGGTWEATQTHCEEFQWGLQRAREEHTPI